jgi:hypothetical protein
MYLLLTIMKNSYLNLAYVFGSVAVDDLRRFCVQQYYNVVPYKMFLSRDFHFT